MIAVAFWGLTRSTSTTSQSILDHIYNQLPSTPYVFVHTFYSNEPYENVRAGESSAEGIKADFAALRPYRVQTEELAHAKRSIDFAAYRTCPDPWKTDYQTVDNFILAMYSKNSVTQMIRNSGLKFKTIIFMRPDVVFSSSVAPVLKLARSDSWVIPSFHVYNGFNDRFCIASPQNYLLYGCVFALLLPYSKTKPLHSETFYADLARRAKVRIQFAPASFVFQRVRLNGTVDRRDLLLHKPVGHVGRQHANAGNVDLHNRVFRNLTVRETFAGPVSHGIFPIWKPARVVLRDV